MSGAAPSMIAIAASIISAVLVLFGLRRVVFAVAALHSPRPFEPGETVLSILVLLAARNEAQVVASALRSLDRLDYPADQIEFTLIDHESTDETSALLTRWADGRPQSRVVTVSRSPGRARGKSAALAAGLLPSPRTDLVAIVDADFEVARDGLTLLVAGFSDPRVAAVSGYLRPRNAERGVVARYAALEYWVHQLVTSAAKDRLGLDPPTLGLWVVRRDVLDAIGGFPNVVTGEDVRVAAAIARHGFRTRFLSTAVASNAVATTLAEYWWQHLRWARDVSGAELKARERLERERSVATTDTLVARLARRGERILGATGYADRLALASAVVLVLLGALPVAIVVGYLATVLIEIGVGIRRGGNRQRRETLYVLAAAVTMFSVDVMATAAAAAAAAIGLESSWRRPTRRAH